MNPLLISLIITISIVYIIDVVRFPQELLSQILHRKVIELKKPFGCSLCMSTWITLIALLILNWKLCWISLICGWSTKYILMTFNLVDRILTKLFVWIERPFRSY